MKGENVVQSLQSDDKTKLPARIRMNKTVEDQTGNMFW